MIKIFVLLALAVVVCARWDGEIHDIPGVSAESMTKLRALMNPRPASREEFRQRIQQWKAGLSETERAAAEEHRRQMIEKHRNSKQE